MADMDFFGCCNSGQQMSEDRRQGAQHVQNTLKVAAFTGGRLASPARFRVRQYVGRLEAVNIHLHEYPARFSAWPPRHRLARPFWAMLSTASRVPGVLASHAHDITLLQQSMISTFVTLEPLTAKPRVLDVDDAIWSFSGRSRFAVNLAKMCDLVICGNAFLADWFSQWNRNVCIIPTGVDTTYFAPGETKNRGPFVVGWSGGSGGFKYLYAIETALVQFFTRFAEAKLLIAANRPPEFQQLDASRIHYISWTPENEVKVIQAMDVGIMPIDDSVSSRGKCSYKMLLYMACGKPVVVSPFGMNGEVLARGDVGYGPRTQDEWVDCLSALVRESACFREMMGARGREVVKNSYDADLTASLLASQLKTLG